LFTKAGFNCQNACSSHENIFVNSLKRGFPVREKGGMRKSMHDERKLHNYNLSSRVEGSLSEFGDTAPKSEFCLTAISLEKNGFSKKIA
jgi:hypothetical protein